MKQYHVLTLTDHRGHSDQNSIYALLRSMNTSGRCASLLVASRGLSQNRAFFTDQQAEELWATSIDDNFTYSPTGKVFHHQLQPVDLAAVNLVFLRLPRPVSDNFLQWLPKVFPQAVFINHPNGILATSTKAFLLQVAELCPPMRLCNTVDEVTSFSMQLPIVLKPLKEYGGRGLLKISEGIVDDGQAKYNWVDYLPILAEHLNKSPYLAMQYLKNVNQGDKRILVVDGEIIAASLRLPPPESWLCNVAQGGTSIPAEVSTEEERIVAALYPHLRTAGILICGVDTLIDDDGLRVLSEVNTLSIGGFPQAEQQTGRPIINQTIEKIFHYADQQRS